MNNLHISLTEFRNESRVLKQTHSLVKSGLVSKVSMAALHADDLKVDEAFSDSIALHRFKLSTRNLSKNFLVQIMKYLEYCWRVFFFYRKKDIKMVNVHSLGLLPLGVFLKWAYKAKLVYDTHELETETNGLSGTRQKLSKFLEKRLIKHVDMTLVVSENIADWYHQEYQIPRPPVVMNAPLYQTPPQSNVFRDTFVIREDQVVFLYQGGLAKGRGVHLLLESFLARNNDKAVIVFMGYGELEQSIISAAEQTNTIVYHPAVAPEVVLNYTVAADVGIHMIQNTCLNHYYCMPNKLFEYAMAGLPVIVSNMKEMQEFVEKYNFGVIADDDTVECINQAVDKMLSLDLQAMKANTQQASVENSWEHQEQKMLNAYAKLFNKEKHHDSK